MFHEDISIRQLVESTDISIDYSDDDIVIIDNVKALVEPVTAHLKMNLLVICMAGRAQGTFNGRQAVMEKGSVFICPPNVTFSDFMISPDFEFKAMFFTSHILQIFLREKMSIWNEAMYIQRTNIVSMNEKDAAYFSLFYDLLRVCINDEGTIPYHTEVVQSLLRAAFVALCARLTLTLAEKSSASQQATRQSGGLFQRFLNLLEQQPVKHRSVESYAAELCITPKYLSAVCKKQSGKTANEWITQQVLADIRYYLKHSDLSIKQICNRLGFPNASFFGKYVKEHFGMTPTQLRSS